MLRESLRQLGIAALIVTFHVDDPRKMRTTKSEVIEEIKTSFPAQVVRLQQREEKGG